MYLVKCLKLISCYLQSYFIQRSIIVSNFTMHVSFLLRFPLYVFPFKGCSLRFAFCICNFKTDSGKI